MSIDARRHHHEDDIHKLKQQVEEAHFLKERLENAREDALERMRAAEQEKDGAVRGGGIILYILYIPFIHLYAPVIHHIYTIYTPYIHHIYT